MLSKIPTLCLLTSIKISPQQLLTPGFCGYTAYRVVRLRERGKKKEETAQSKQMPTHFHMGDPLYGPIAGHAQEVIDENQVAFTHSGPAVMDRSALHTTKYASLVDELVESARTAGAVHEMEDPFAVTPLESFGMFLRSLRRKKQLSRAQVALRAGLPQPLLAQMEMGRAPLAQVSLWITPLARAVEVKPGVLSQFLFDLLAEIPE